MRETNDAKELDELLGSIDLLQGYSTVEFLKHSAYEKTSVVTDELGRQYICKVLDTDASPHPYELLEKRACVSVPKIHSCTRVGDELIVIMEKLEGMTLAQLVSVSGPVDPKALLTMFEGVFNALGFLHSAYAAPVIHRDIKPENIMVTPQGTMLIDFGIARTWDQNASCDTRLMGTSGYAAPEQFGFMQTDARSDIYALGMTLRFALTGAAPGQEARVEPEDLARVIGKACEFDPKRRYARVEDFERELKRALEGARSEKRHAWSQAERPQTAQAQTAVQAQAPQARTETSQAQTPTPLAQAQHQGKQTTLNATRPRRTPPSERKPSVPWRVFQALTAAMALYTLWVVVTMQIDGKNDDAFTSIVMTLGMCALPAYYICDPFDALRKRGAHDKRPVMIFFILMAIGCVLAILSLMLELYVFHTTTVGG